MYMSDTSGLPWALRELLGQPVYKNDGVDEDGNIIVVPVFVSQ